MEIPQVDPGKSEMGGNGNLLQTARPTLEIVEQSDKSSEIVFNVKICMILYKNDGKS